MENGQPGLLGKAATSLDIAYSLFDTVPQRRVGWRESLLHQPALRTTAALNFGSVYVQYCHLFISSFFPDFSRQLQKVLWSCRKIDRSSQASLMQEFRCCSQNIPPPLGLRETTRFIVDYSARTTSTTTDNFFPSSSSSRQCPNAHAACSGRRLKKSMR